MILPRLGNETSAKKTNPNRPQRTPRTLSDRISSSVETPTRKPPPPGRLRIHLNFVWTHCWGPLAPWQRIPRSQRSGGLPRVISGPFTRSGRNTVEKFGKRCESLLPRNEWYRGRGKRIRTVQCLGEKVGLSGSLRWNPCSFWGMFEVLITGDEKARDCGYIPTRDVTRENPPKYPKRGLKQTTLGEKTNPRLNLRRFTSTGR